MSSINNASLDRFVMVEIYKFDKFLDSAVKNKNPSIYLAVVAKSYNLVESEVFDKYLDNFSYYRSKKLDSELSMKWGLVKTHKNFLEAYLTS